MPAALQISSPLQRSASEQGVPAATGVWVIPPEGVQASAVQGFASSTVAGAPPPEDDDPFALSLLEKAGLMRRKEQERRVRLPPSTKRVDPERRDQFSSDENQAMDWLQDDDEEDGAK